MAMPVIQVPTYPDVPDAPGVPPVRRQANVQNTVLLVTNLVGRLRRFLLGTRWGIFSEEGIPLLIGDSVKAFDYKKDARLADYPLEKGGFGSYNKVQTPYDARLSFSVGGTEASRAAFLKMCDKLIASLTIVTAVTPEISYPSANVVHYDLRRTSQNGVTLLTVEVWIQEVRQTARTEFTQAGETASPSGADVQSGGQVQAATPNPVQEAAAPQQGGLY